MVQTVNVTKKSSLRNLSESSNHSEIEMVKSVSTFEQRQTTITGEHAYHEPTIMERYDYPVVKAKGVGKNSKSSTANVSFTSSSCGEPKQIVKNVNILEKSNENQMVHTRENQFDVESLFEGYEHVEDKENYAPKETGRKYELSSHSNMMDYLKRQQDIKMAEELGKRVDRQTMQMLVQAGIKREEESREREKKLMALLEKLSK